jgi:predicted metal-dependent phosphoesterase TrpH
MHTKEASACAQDTGAEMARAYKEAGYDGIIITDHFFNGNTAIDRSLPWEERVHLFCRGYENALEEGKRLNLHVFFGWEYGYHGTEFLTYGLNKEYLLNNPSILSWSLEEYFQNVHEHDGFITHAHPFREAPYIKEIRLYPDFVDAVEVVNTANQVLFNSKALAYAEKYNLPQTCGSDAHQTVNIRAGKNMGGMEFETELFSIQDFIKAVKRRKNYRILGDIPIEQL